MKLQGAFCNLQKMDRGSAVYLDLNKKAQTHQGHILYPLGWPSVSIKLAGPQVGHYSRDWLGFPASLSLLHMGLNYDTKFWTAWGRVGPLGCNYALAPVKSGSSILIQSQVSNETHYNIRSIKYHCLAVYKDCRCKILCPTLFYWSTNTDTRKVEKM